MTHFANIKELSTCHCVLDNGMQGMLWYLQSMQGFYSGKKLVGVLSNNTYPQTLTNKLRIANEIPVTQAIV